MEEVCFCSSVRRFLSVDRNVLWDENYSPMFPKLDPGLPLPTFDHLAIDDGNTIGEQIEAGLDAEDEYRRIRDMRLAWENSINELIGNTFAKGGMPDTADVERMILTGDAYLPVRNSYLQQDQFSYLTEPYSRTTYDITPPQSKTKHNLGNKIGVWNSAMYDIFPGTSEEHRALLRKHRALFHFPRRLASLGAVFVTPPGMDTIDHLDDLKEVVQAMRDADPYWHVPPKFFLDTSVDTARSVFEHYEDDWPATVEDEGGTILGVITKDSLRGRTDRTSVGDCMEKDVHWAANPSMTPSEAYDLMELKGKNYVMRHMEGRDPEIITRSSAVFSELLPPFEYQGGLGFVVYLGVRNQDRTADVIRQLGVNHLPGVMIDPAHGFTGNGERLLKGLREDFPDLFIGAGNFNNPQAVQVLKDTIDLMKTPIGLGGVCDTYRAGMRVPDAYATMRLLMVAHSLGIPVLVDGLGGERQLDPRYRYEQMDDSTEFVVKKALPGVVAEQGGGFFIARPDSSNPTTEHMGRRGKWASGEGSNNANKRVGRNFGRIENRKLTDAGIEYSEGVEDRFYPRRKPTYMSQALYFHYTRLRSIMSYVFSHKLLRLPAGETIRLFQSTAKVIHTGSENKKK